MANLNDGGYYRAHSDDDKGLKLLCNSCHRKALNNGSCLIYLGPVNQKQKCDKCGCTVMSHSNFVTDIEALQLARYGRFCLNCD